MTLTAFQDKVNVGGSVTSALTNVFAFIPKLVAAIVIFVVFYIVAKILQKVLTKVLQKVGFDDLVERGGVKTALARSQYDAAGILAKLVYYVILLFGLSTAMGVFGRNPISNYLTAIIAFLPKLFVAIVILVIAAAIAAGVKSFISSALGGLSYGPALGTISSVAIIFFGIVAALNQIGVATAITTPIEIAVLASITGILIVGVGGGLVRPMQERWENALQRVSAESSTVKENMARRKDELVEQGKNKVQQSNSQTSGSPVGGRRISPPPQ
jgi:hypothetical protein